MRATSKADRLPELKHAATRCRKHNLWVWHFDLYPFPPITWYKWLRLCELHKAMDRAERERMVREFVAEQSTAKESGTDEAEEQEETEGQKEEEEEEDEEQKEQEQDWWAAQGSPEKAPEHGPGKGDVVDLCGPTPDARAKQKTPQGRQTPGHQNLQRIVQIMQDSMKDLPMADLETIVYEQTRTGEHS